MSVNTSATTATVANMRLEIAQMIGGSFLWSAPTATCTSWTFSEQIAADGTITVPARSSVFFDCWQGWRSSFVQSGGWTGALKHLDNPSTRTVTAVTQTLTIPSNALRYTLLSCSFDLVGTLLGEYVPTRSTPHLQLIDVPAIRFPATLAPTTVPLVVQNASGCTGLSFVNGAPARITFDTVLSPAINLAGSNHP